MLKKLILVYLTYLIAGSQAEVHSHDDEHFCLETGEPFDGHRHYTTEGHTCLFWKDVWTQGANGFPDASLEAAENNCRDPDNRGQPWCYTSRDPQRWGFCDILKCNDKEAVIMTPQECSTGRLRAGYKNGDRIPIYSDKWDRPTTDIAYPGCSLRFEACKSCKFHIKVDAELPVCSRQTNNKQCAEGCQTLAIRDGLYNDTISELYSGTVVGAETFHTTSNVLIVHYCQLVNTFSQRPAKYKVTAFVTTKHTHQTARSGTLKSPNFPNGYYSEKETYVYSVDPPLAQLDSNLTLLFYDWDLNGSAGSRVMIKWTEKLHNGSSVQLEKSFGASDYRPALFLASSSFQMVFETGRINVNNVQEEIGFTAKYNHIDKPNWIELPDTRCGRYLPRSEAIGGTLTYHRLASPDLPGYSDCVWVIPIPSGYTHLRYNVTTEIHDSTVSVTIRDGVTSEGLVKPRTGIVSGRGLYIRIAGLTKDKNTQFNMTYLATAKAYGGECRTVERRLMFYCPLLDRCVDQELYVTHAKTVCGIDTKPKPIVCPVFTCADGLSCYDQVSKCNMYKDCKDGSDEDIDMCYGDAAEPAPSVNLPLAISLPIVGVLFLIPIIIIIVYIIRQRRDEIKDEELMASKKQLMKTPGATGGAADGSTSSAGGGGGVDNPGLQLDDIPLSVVERRPAYRPDQPRDYTDHADMAPPLKKPNPKFDEIRADIHQGKSPYSPRGPGETQSVRVDPLRPDPRPTRSHRFELPPDIDSITEMPTEPYKPPRRGRDSRTPPRTPTDKPTLANYRFDERPYGEPEGRSYRDPEPRETSYRDYRQPGDGGYGNSPKLQDQPIQKPLGARPKTYENYPPSYDQLPDEMKPNNKPRFEKNALSQYRPERDVPGRYQKGPQDSRPQTTQSYRAEPERYQAPPREARSYRFPAEDMNLHSSTEV